MIVKVVAIWALVVLSIVCTLGTYWFVFGLWPLSWGWFMFFTFLQIVNSTFMGLVLGTKDE